MVFSTSPSQECVNVTIVNDNAVEQNEEFLVELDLPPSDLAVSIGALDQTTVLILDDGESLTCDKDPSFVWLVHKHYIIIS